jgi:hypothetical protein
VLFAAEAATFFEARLAGVALAATFVDLVEAAFLVFTTASLLPRAALTALLVLGIMDIC